MSIANNADANTSPLTASTSTGGDYGSSLKSGLEVLNVSPAVLMAWLTYLGDMADQSNWLQALQIAMLANANSGSHATGKLPNEPVTINGGGALGGTPGGGAQSANAPQTVDSLSSPGAAQSQTSPFVFTDLNGGSSTAALAQSSDPLASPNQSADFGAWADLLDPNRPSAQTTLSSTDPLNGAFNPIAASSLAQSPMGAA